MGSKSLVICDPEEQYAQALAFYIMNRKDIHFQVQVCSETEHVNVCDILLISDVYSDEERKRVKADKIFVLTEQQVYTADEEKIFKYQPGEQILAEIIKCCEELYQDNEIFISCPKKKAGKIIGIFSPVHRIGKTTYALKLGEKLAVSENVLYLNLELYGGLGGHFDEGETTLADVLYYVKQEKANLGFMMTKAVRHRGRLDYILPVPVSEDIKEVSAEEWLELIRQLMRQSIYETIILDIDEGIRDVYKLLKNCSQIYLLTDQTPYALAKVRQFEKELELLGYEEILGKVIRKDEAV